MTERERLTNLEEGLLLARGALLLAVAHLHAALTHALLLLAVERLSLGLLLRIKDGRTAGALRETLLLLLSLSESLSLGERLGGEVLLLEPLKRVEPGRRQGRASWRQDCPGGGLKEESGARRRTYSWKTGQAKVARRRRKESRATLGQQLTAATSRRRLIRSGEQRAGRAWTQASNGGEMSEKSRKEREWSTALRGRGS